MVEIIIGISTVPRAWVFFKISISKVGGGITVCIVVVPDSWSDRLGFCWYCANVEEEEVADWGFLRCGYGVFTLLL